ncbi:MAG: DUF1801 domain-containing protein [Spirochaetota bacterium]
MQSKALTVADYLESLPADRRKAVSAIRAVIKNRLPKGYAEMMQYGMIGYVVPLSRYPDGYLGKKDIPVPYAALASQKGYIAVYLMNVYADKDALTVLRRDFTRAGKKLSMGKSCIRFKRIDDVSLDAIGNAVARTSVDDHIAAYEKARGKKRVR